MRFFQTALLLLTFTGALFSQETPAKQQRLDSLTAKLYTDSLRTFRFKKLRPYANIDNRNSFITKRPTNISGFQLGVIVNEYHTFGFGTYVLNQASRRDAPIARNYRFNKLHYFTAFYEYVMFNERFFEVDLPFEIGAGNYSAKLLDTIEAGRPGPGRYNFLPLGAGAKVILKPVRWIGLSIMGGYRYVLQGKQSLLNLDGAYYSFGVWVDLRQIYRDIKYYGFQKRKYKKAVRGLSENS